MADDNDTEARSISLENSYVHNVYDQTAHHFENSSYKAWPRVRRFLKDLEPGSLVADVGCGYGRYLHVNSKIVTFGSDRCPQLAAIAANGGAEVAICDNLQLPYRDGCFDAVVSVGVVHHFASRARRCRAISELARIVRPGGRLIICVWAMEQRRRKFKTQDVLVPWHLKPKLHTEGKLSQKNSLNDDDEDDLNSERSRSDDGSCRDNGDASIRHSEETCNQSTIHDETICLENNQKNGRMSFTAQQSGDLMCDKISMNAHCNQKALSPQTSATSSPLSLAKQLKRRLSGLFANKKSDGKKTMMGHVTEKDLAYKRLLERIANDDMEALLREEAHDRFNGFAVREFPLSSQLSKTKGQQVAEGSLTVSETELLVKDCDTTINRQTNTAGNSQTQHVCLKEKNTSCEIKKGYTNINICLACSRSNCIKRDKADELVVSELTNGLNGTRCVGCKSMLTKNQCTAMDSCDVDCIKNGDVLGKWSMPETNQILNDSSTFSGHCSFSGDTSRKTEFDQDYKNGEIINTTDFCSTLSNSKQFCSNYYHLTNGDVDGDENPQKFVDISYQDVENDVLNSQLNENVDHSRIDSSIPVSNVYEESKFISINDVFNDCVDSCNTHDDDDVFTKLSDTHTNGEETKSSFSSLQLRDASNPHRSTGSEDDWCVAPAQAIASMQQRQAAQREAGMLYMSPCLSPSLLRRVMSHSPLISVSSESSSMFDSDDDLCRIGDTSYVPDVSATRDANRVVSPCPHSESPVATASIALNDNPTAEIVLDANCASNVVPTQSDDDDDGVKFQRFYHVFTSGELVSLIQDVDCLEVVQSYYDHANWCVIVEKVCVWRI